MAVRPQANDGTGESAQRRWQDKKKEASSNAKRWCRLTCSIVSSTRQRAASIRKTHLLSYVKGEYFANGWELDNCATCDLSIKSQSFQRNWSDSEH